MFCWEYWTINNLRIININSSKNSQIGWNADFHYLTFKVYFHLNLQDDINEILRKNVVSKLLIIFWLWFYVCSKNWFLSNIVRKLSRLHKLSPEMLSGRTFDADEIFDYIYHLIPCLTTFSFIFDMSSETVVPKSKLLSYQANHIVIVMILIFFPLNKSVINPLCPLSFSPVRTSFSDRSKTLHYQLHQRVK